MKQILTKHLDVFCWGHEDLPGIDPNIIPHQLCVDPKKIRQKRQSFSVEKCTAITEEVNRLLAAGFNVVLVKKANNK